MRKILIPIDFSENAINAMKYACELFKYERSEFFILHTYADEVYDSQTDVSRITLEKLKESVHKKSDREVTRIVRDTQNLYPNPRHTFHTLSIFNTLIDGSNEIVDLENIDIVIMGTRGKTDDRKLPFGSNTLQVLKYVKCPVLAIPSGYSYQQPKNILFPTDYFLPYKRRELKLLSTLTKSFRSTITFLHISKFEKLSIRQEDNKTFLTTSLSKTNLQFKRIENGGLTLAINDFIRQNAVDLLVMCNSRHSYLESVLYQSTIDKIGLHIKLPFLILQNVSR